MDAFPWDLRERTDLGQLLPFLNFLVLRLQALTPQFLTDMNPIFFVV